MQKDPLIQRQPKYLRLNTGNLTETLIGVSRTEKEYKVEVHHILDTRITEIKIPRTEGSNLMTSIDNTVFALLTRPENLEEEHRCRAGMLPILRRHLEDHKERTRKQPDGKISHPELRHDRHAA